LFKGYPSNKEVVPNSVRHHSVTLSGVSFHCTWQV